MYRDNFLENKNSPTGTYQNNHETQYMRFERIIKPFKEILNENISLHDLGCGACEMHNYLNLQGIKHNYSGTEIVQEMIDYAQNKYPTIKVFNRDVLKKELIDEYDIVVFSGGLYLPGSIPAQEWEQFVYAIIKKMWTMSKIGISFNLLTTYSDYTRPDLYYVDPKNMFDFCMNNFSRFVTIDHGYPLYEWTISVFRKEYMKNKYSQPEFQRYFLL